MMHECPKCRNTGKCPVCGGSGRFNDRIVSCCSTYKEKDICPFCKGTAVCSACQGEAKDS